MNNTINNITSYLSGTYKSIIKYIINIIPINYIGLPIEKLFNTSLIITLAILVLCRIIKWKKKRYYSSTFCISILIGILSIIMLGLVKKYSNSKMLLDTIQGFFICLIGLCYYSTIFSLLKICKNKMKCILPILFFTFTGSYVYMMLRNEFLATKIDMLNTLALLLISPLWLVYVPYAAIGIVYIYGISLFSLIGRKEKDIPAK